MTTINAIGAVRVSSTKQGLQGDSPEDQKVQNEGRKDQLSSHLGQNIKIIQWFEFVESASGELEMQPILKALEYCKNPKNKIKYFFFKSIDRGTRGGATIYGQLKSMFSRYGVQFVDVYGVIGTQTVNTLEHLKIKYNWSEFSPTWISELLEAERAKGEVRDILTRLIGAEIRYVRMGYRVRQAPPGYMNEKIDTIDGKRVILKPHPVEGNWFIRMYELRAQGTLNDNEIVEAINNLGYKSRRYKIHDTNNKKLITGYGGESPLTVKQLQRYITNPIYAGINAEKWLDGKPIKTRFEGLVSVDLWNRANKGKITIIEDRDQVYIYHGKPSPWQVKRQVENPLYPYKKEILCPFCRNPFLGSAPRSKSGKHHPTYHCARGHDYFGIPVAKLNESVDEFVGKVHFSEGFIKRFREILLEEWEKRKSQVVKDSITVEEQVLKLKNQAQLITEKIKILTSEVAIKAMEAELEKIELQKIQLIQNRNKVEKKEIDITTVINYLQYYMEHVGELVLGSDNPIQNAAMFGLLFDSPPTYEELINGTPKLAPIVALNHAFNISQEQFVNVFEKIRTYFKETC